MTEKTYPLRDDLEADNLDPNTSYAKVLELAGRNKRVLDVGCATGYLARLLSAHGCEVVGIDVNADAAKVAAPFCSKVIVADLDFQLLDSVLGGQTFDVVVFADVLEHLRNPWRTLEHARRVLVPGGHAVVSIPNIAHGAIRLALLGGKFDYRDVGILDDTHLRFFTRRTVDELFVRTGYEVERVERTVLRLFETSNLVPALTPEDYDPTTIARVRADAEFETLQFVVRARALDDDARVAQLSRAFVKASTDLDDALEAPRRTESQLREQLAAGELANRTQAAEIKELTAKLTDEAAELQRYGKREAELELHLHTIVTMVTGTLNELRAQAALLRRELVEAQIAHESLLARLSELYAQVRRIERLQDELDALRREHHAQGEALTVADAERGRLAAELAAFRGGRGSGRVALRALTAAFARRIRRLFSGKAS